MPMNLSDMELRLRDRLHESIGGFRALTAEYPQSQAILGPLITSFEGHLAEVTARIEENTNG